MLLASAVCFAAVGPLAKALYSTGWSPGTVVLVRLIGAAVLLAVPAVLALRGSWPTVLERRWSLLGFGFVSVAGTQIFFFLSLSYLDVGIAILIEIMGAPIIVVLWVWIRHGVRPRAVTVAGMAIASLGLVAVLAPAETSLHPLGIVLALAAAACFASYFVFAAHQDGQIPPVALNALGMVIGALVTFVVTLTPVMPAALELADVMLAGAEQPWFMPAALLVLTTVGAYWLGAIGLRPVGATVGAFINLLEIPLAAILAWLLLSERLQPLQIVGAAVVMLGIVMVQAGEAPKEDAGGPKARAD